MENREVEYYLQALDLNPRYVTLSKAMKKVIQHGERRSLHLCNIPDYWHNWTHFDILSHVWNELWHQSTYDNPLVDKRPLQFVLVIKIYHD